MCLAVPGKVLELLGGEGGMARVDVAGRPREVNLSLLADDEQAAPGDWVLVHAGFALGRVDEAEAIELVGMLAELTQPAGEVSPVP